VETNVTHRAIARARPERREELLAQVRGWDTAGGVWASINPDKRLVAEMLFAGQRKVTYGRLGSAILRLYRAGEVIPQWIELADKEPENWCPEEFVRWRAAIIEESGG
jgi:hypothetical protein